MTVKKAAYEETVSIPLKGGTMLAGEISLPAETKSIVLFAHGSGSSRMSPRNRFVAQYLQQQGLGTLLFDLLTPEEERSETHTGEWRFNIPLLVKRLISATEWVLQEPHAKDFRIGYFGASTGAAAAIVAAVELNSVIGAIVSRGGRPDLAALALKYVQAPTLLLVGGNDFDVLTINQRAFMQLPCKKKLEVVPGATHLFSEPGALQEVARLASIWFQVYL